MGSMSGEWKAWEMFKSCVWMPLEAKLCSSVCTDSRAPDITVFSGLLIPAMET